jgi:hypothetical protein
VENIGAPAGLPASAVVHQGIGVLVAPGGLTLREAEAALHDVAARAGRTPVAVARLLLEGARRGTVDVLLGDALRTALDERLAAAFTDRRRFGRGEG